ncbi:Elongation of very long chain fatty acids protein 1 [Trachymyrmex zeteki]|uniref:Elongation of very long chain fatty acids protein n=1 Tax=Mycetomoellerius zeteki TaxID=64791 RepID=A0A151WF85_9HYME|nr:Elongation of very long chain fatty acids protein 1 [Trachymyrmex zeteki]
MLRGAYGQRDTFALHQRITRMHFTDTQKVKWLLVSAPMPVIFISIAYFYIVYIAGPQFMKNRQPYSLKPFMQCYNLLQIISNAWIVFNFVTYGRPFTAIWRFCESLDELCGNYSEKAKNKKQSKCINLTIISFLDRVYLLFLLQVFETLWWVLMLKLFDLIETVVFVLRKKDRQISFLHTYHHASTFIYSWLMFNYFNHSFNMTSMLLNCSVHVVMYSYYFLSTYGSNMQRILLPIKKSITIIQMTHIAFIMIVSMQGFIPSCGTKMLKVYFNNKATRIILNQQTSRTIVLHRYYFVLRRKGQDGNSFTAQYAIFVHYGNWLDVAGGSVGSHIAYGNPEVASLGRRITTFERPRNTAVVAAEFMYFLDNNFVGCALPSSITGHKLQWVHGRQ